MGVRQAGCQLLCHRNRVTLGCSLKGSDMVVMPIAPPWGHHMKICRQKCFFIAHKDHLQIHSERKGTRSLNGLPGRGLDFERNRKYFVNSTLRQSTLCVPLATLSIITVRLNGLPLAAPSLLTPGPGWLLWVWWKWAPGRPGVRRCRLHSEFPPELPSLGSQVRPR